MSLVLIWPSTVIRSKEAGDGGAQGGVGVLDHGVGLHEAEHRREARLDHPGALRLGGEGDAAGPQRAALRPAVGGQDRLGEGRRRRSPRAPPAASPIPPSTASIGSGTPITPVSATATSSGVEAEPRAGLAAHRPGVGEPLLAGLGVGVAGVDDGGADRAALDPVAADPDRRRGRGVAGQQHRGGDLLGVADEQADVGLAAALEAAVGGAGAEAGRELRGVELLDAGRRLDPARPEEGRVAHVSSPSRLVEAQHQVEVLDAPGRRRPSRGCRSPRRRARGRAPRPST